jgi:uncharacterized membrane protein YeaQ/YmgE (transglycosylase-associated protein family)
MDATGWWSWIIVGALAGWLASVMTTNRQQAFRTDIVVGMVGAVIGGFLFNTLGGSLFVAFVGAVILLGLSRMMNNVRTV